MNKVYECSGCGWTGTKAEHKAMMERPGVIACCPDMKLVEISNPEMLPCPFCGGAPTVEAPGGDAERRGWPKGVWLVSCNEEPYHSGWAVGMTRETAVERWNERRRPTHE